MPTLLLLALATFQTAPTQPAIDAKVRVHESAVFVFVWPPEPRTVRTITVHPRPSSDVPKPRAMAPLELRREPERAVSARFARPRTTFYVVIALDDGSRHRVDGQEEQPTIFRIDPRFPRDFILRPDWRAQRRLPASGHPVPRRILAASH